jgi:hypothetical protein
MSYEQIEQRRTQLGPARNIAEQLCYEAIEDTIMDVIAAQREGDSARAAIATARAEAYLEAISIYQRTGGKGRPFANSAPPPNTPALIAAMRTALLAVRSNPAGAEAVLINALAAETGQIN